MLVGIIRRSGTIRKINRRGGGGSVRVVLKGGGEGGGEGGGKGGGR